MQFIQQKSIDEAVLFHLFMHSQKSEKTLSAAQLSSRFEIEVSARRILLAFDSLLGRRVVELSPADGSAFITRRGYEQVERDLQNHESEIHRYATGGDRWLASSTVNPGSIPASDRIVTLNHNAPEYEEISTAIDELIEKATAWNGNPDNPNERDRILFGLTASKDLLNSIDLKLIQVKVGIILAIEDAQKALGLLVKTLSGKLVVDVIKGLIKNHTGIDLDHI